MQQLPPRRPVRPECQHSEREQRAGDPEPPPEDEPDACEHRHCGGGVDDEARDRTAEEDGDTHPVEPGATVAQLQEDG